MVRPDASEHTVVQPTEEPVVQPAAIEQTLVQPTEEPVVQPGVQPATRTMVQPDAS